MKKKTNNKINDALSQIITLSGIPTNFQKLIIRIKDNGTAQAITWGDSFEAKGVALPTATVISDEVAIVRFDGISEYPKRINRR